MKKRKTPILLLSVLVVLLGAVAVFGMQNMKNDKSSEEPEQVTQEHAAPTPEGLENSIKGSTARAPMMSRKPAIPLNGPSIATSSRDQAWKKPVPDSGGAPSSQWYNNR